MAAPLVRGANVALTREIPSLSGVVVGIRWNAAGDAALSDNLVAGAFLCDVTGNVVSDRHLVFFNQLVSPDSSVTQLRQLVGDDDEQLEVDLDNVPADVDRIIVMLYFNEGSAAKRTLGQLRSCVVRVMNLADNSELVRSEDLAPALTSETALLLGQLYRHSTGWKFKVIGQGSSAGLRGLAQAHGLEL